MKLYRILETTGVAGHNYQTVGVLETDAGNIKTLESVATRIPEGTYRYTKVNDAPAGTFSYLLLEVPGRRKIRLGYTPVDTDGIYSILCGEDFAYSTELDRLVFQHSMEVWRRIIMSLPIEGRLQVASRISPGLGRLSCVSLAKETVYDLHPDLLSSLAEEPQPRQVSNRPVDALPLDVLDPNTV
jgi:hypothetical protein